MASLVTLDQLRTQVRQRVDMVSNNIVTDDELAGYINASLAELHQELVDVDSEHVIKTTTWTLNGSERYALPSDFYKDKLTEFDNGTWKANLRRVSLAQKNSVQGFLYSGAVGGLFGNVTPNLAYFVADGYVYVLPKGYTGGTLGMWYYPTATVLSGGSDSVDVLNRFDEFIISDVCAKVCDKLDLPVAAWERRREAARLRVQTSGQDRDMGDSWGMSMLPRGRSGW